MEEKRNDFVEVLKFLLKWKWYLLSISLIAAFLAAIFSGPFFIHPKFRSIVVFYPAANQSASKALVSENSFSESDLLSFGKAAEAEQFLQILQSDVIASKLKHKYNLMDHYRINKNARYKNTKFGKVFRKNVTSELTKYMSIKVTVMDESPELAAKIADDVVKTMDSIRNAIQKERAMEGLKIVENDLNDKITYVQHITDSLKKIAELGVLKYKEQSDALTTAYSDALISGKQNIVKLIEEKMVLMSKYGPIQEMLSGELEFETEELVLLRKKYKQAKIDVESNLPNIFIIENAYVAEKKSYPRRSLISLLAFAGAFVFSTLVFLFIEQARKLKAKNIF